jgi:hypothetical protein
MLFHYPLFSFPLQSGERGGASFEKDEILN